MNTAFIESGVGKNFKSNLKTSNPSMGKLTMLAVYFNVPVNYLLGKSPRPTIMQIAKLEEGNYEADLQKASAQNANKKGDHTVAEKSNLIPLSPFVRQVTEHEGKVLDAYRAQVEMQPAVDRLLDVPAEEETVTLYSAAYSKDNTPEEIITISKAEWERLKSLPFTDQDL